jgi:ribonucleoside-diphosphate reductase alpha chain
MSRRRSGRTTTVTIDTERFWITANQRDDGSLGEVFIHWDKHGSSGAGLAHTYAIVLSLGLEHQVPLADLVRSGLDQSFVPNGRTDDPEIPRARDAATATRLWTEAERLTGVSLAATSVA